MALFGTTDDNSSRLRHMQTTLSHRGTTQITGRVGGQFIESNEDVHIAWAGTIRSGHDSLLAAYTSSGIEFVRELRGEFVIAIQDGDTLSVIRDGAGVRTAYFGQLGDHWFISVEPKGIWSLPGFARRLRHAAVAQYFTYSFIPGAKTMLENLWEVPAGHYVRLQQGSRADICRYFHVQLQPCDDDVPLSEWPRRFRNLLEAEVAARLKEVDQPVVFLSGGLDSTIITAEVAKQSSQRVRTYAVHFGRKYPNELEFARSVAQRFNTDHEEVEISPKRAVARIREMIWYLDEPIGDPITAPNFELAAHVANQGVKHVFNGEGGDPLFGGPKNLTMLMSHWYGGVDFEPGFRERRYLESYRRGFEEIEYLLTPEFREQICEERDLHAPLTPFFDADGPFLHKLLAINTQLKGAHLILPKVERMLAASGVSPVSPLFTEDMIRLAFAAPPHAKLQRGVEKWLMKEAYRNDLPREIIDRPKSGMRVPVHFWFKGPLRRFAKRFLNTNTLSQQGIFDIKRVNQLLKYDTGCTNGRYGLKLWMILTFEIWRRIVVDDEAP